jgi:hypothetical protein
MENVLVGKALIRNEIPVSGANRDFEQNQLVPHKLFSIFHFWIPARLAGLTHRRVKSASDAGMLRIEPNNTDSRRGRPLAPAAGASNEETPQ